MLAVRTKAAAILLKDGRVLVTGGDSSGQIANTLEIYDPAENRFRVARGVLSFPQAGHLIALLNDGRILIAGGTDGAHVLNSIDIFDPATEETVPPASWSHHDRISPPRRLPMAAYSSRVVSTVRPPSHRPRFTMPRLVLARGAPVVSAPAPYGDTAGRR